MDPKNPTKTGNDAAKKAIERFFSEKNDDDKGKESKDDKKTEEKNDEKNDVGYK